MRYLFVVGLSLIFFSIVYSIFTGAFADNELCKTADIKNYMESRTIVKEDELIYCLNKEVDKQNALFAIAVGTAILVGATILR